jgi:hypothetical protein
VQSIAQPHATLFRLPVSSKWVALIVCEVSTSIESEGSLWIHRDRSVIALRSSEARIDVSHRNYLASPTGFEPVLPP